MTPSVSIPESVFHTYLNGDVPHPVVGRVKGSTLEDSTE